MSVLEDIRAAIKAKILTVPNVGTVHDRERYATDQGSLRALYAFGDPARIQGWHIRRLATEEVSPALGRYVVTNEWAIRGFMGFDDADQSEILFDGLIEQIRDVFRVDETLGGVVVATAPAREGTEKAIGIQVVDSGPVMFAGVLCHSAQLRLFTMHFL